MDWCMTGKGVPANGRRSRLLAVAMLHLAWGLLRWCFCCDCHLAAVLRFFPGLGARHRAKRRWLGVNYGNRFIPEDWMRHPHNFFAGVRQHEHVDRVALWDLADGQKPSPRERMLAWLNATIAEEHFAAMRRSGVEVVRVPCGYWNWVSYRRGNGPVAAESVQGVPVAQQLKNLHQIASPREYRPFFDKIFAYAAMHDIKVLLDLHGLPGSQNGEIHSGACIELGGNRMPYFEAEANKRTAIRAVRAMAKYAGHKRSSLFGIQVINEPHLQSADKGHSFLRDYYERAVLAAREFLDPSIPIILFEWTYSMENWSGDDFPEAQFGNVMWDTHLYHFPEEGEQWTPTSAGLGKIQEAYKWDLQQLRSFSKSQEGRVLVGEFALAGPSLDKPGSHELAKWMLDQFSFAAAGCLVWAFDGVHPAWSMCKQAAVWGLDWRRLIGTARADAARRGQPVALAAAGGGCWLSAREDGSVRVTTAAPSLEEEWVPYRCGAARQGVALRSAAHGQWLSVDETGKVSQAVWQDAWEEFTPVACGAEGEACIRLLSAHKSWLSALPELGAVIAVPSLGGMCTLEGQEDTWTLSCLGPHTSN